MIMRLLILVPAFLIVVYAAVSGVKNLYSKFSSKNSGAVATAQVNNTEAAAKQEPVKAPPPPEKESPAAAAENPVKEASEAAKHEESVQKQEKPATEAPAAPLVRPASATYAKKDIVNLLGKPGISNFMTPSFEVQHGNSKLTVQTTLNKHLQDFLNESIESVRNLRNGKPRYFGMIVMNPETGKILGMGGFDGDADKGFCPGSLYPAASVFKIVTAAAAVESKGFTPGTVMLFHGNKYTLYKSQVNDSRDRYATKMTLNDSFAQSVNPVFGKIGSQYLNKDTLMTFGSTLGFNKKFDFELPLEPSFLQIPDDKFQQAEIASGYNRETKISPIHGAMIVSAVINEGRLPEPYIVENITNDKGELIFQASPRVGDQVINPETARTISKLMETTVTKGTGRKSFAGAENDVVLKNLDMGGKTGSIDNPTHEVRFDWFVGFAKNDEGKKVALAIVVGHEKLIGTKASRYARMIFRRYFQMGDEDSHGKNT